MSVAAPSSLKFCILKDFIFIYYQILLLLLYIKEIIFFNLVRQNTEFLFMSLNDSYRTEIDSWIQPTAFQSELLTRWKNSRWIKVIKIQLII